MWIVCITSVRHVLTVNGYGGRQTKENEKSWCFKGWETLVNKIFEELKHVQVKTCPNASSVLLRVFLELSVDAYLEKFDLVRNNAITACSSGESLQGKVGKVLNHMTQLGTMSNDLSKGIRSEINDKNSVLSIESLNAYVHNEFFYPKADNLITGWDNIESFFIQLWESIKNKE